MHSGGSPPNSDGGERAPPVGATSASAEPTPQALATASAQRQLHQLLEPGRVLGRVDGDWLRHALAAAGDSRTFCERHLEDPLLELLPRAAGHLGKRALLIDPERLAERLIALLAVRGRFMPAAQPIEALIQRCLDDGVDQILHEDMLDEAQHLPPEPGFETDHALAGELFGVPEPFQRLVLLRFNRLAQAQRRCLFDWVARGTEPHRPVPGTAAAKTRNSELRLTLDDARAILSEVLALPRGGVR